MPIRIDPNSVEALTLRASLAMRRRDHAAAAVDVVEVLKRLENPEKLRLYDIDDAPAFKQSLEELLVELRHFGAEIPAHLDLSAAEARIEARARAMMEAEQERRAEMEAQRRGPPRDADAEHRELDPNLLKRTGRNDPCPCGSGKKFKKCHGAG